MSPSMPAIPGAIVLGSGTLRTFTDTGKQLLPLQAQPRLVASAIQAGGELLAKPKVMPQKAEKKSKGKASQPSEGKAKQAYPVDGGDAPYRQVIEQLSAELAQARKELHEYQNKHSSTTSSMVKEHVKFATSIGQLRMSARVIDDGSCFALVFDAEEDITFIPEPGHRFPVTVRDRTVTAWSPGILLHWIDGTSLIMILVKEPTDA